MEKGIYEQIINKRIDQELKKLNADYFVETEKIKSKESARRLSNYLSQFIEKILEKKANKTNEEQIVEQIELVNKIVDFVVSEKNIKDFRDELIHDRGEILLSLLERNANNQLTDEKGIRPETSISTSTLFTGSHNEPSLAKEILREIKSSDQVDLIVSFIKWNGLRLIFEALKDFTKSGGKLRIITTTYMRATEVKAIEELANLPNTKIKISYDTNKTRLHAKSYIFWRKSGFSTAYIGSSNISVPALAGGLEWNVKITNQDQPLTLKKINLTFESYWQDSDFVLYDENSIQKLQETLTTPKIQSSEYYFDIKPYRFQEAILEQLRVEREIHGNYKNLVVAATGTGKTVISAWDYQRFSKNNSLHNRLLFIAHREEILEQSISCFRGILKDQNFGDKYVGRFVPGSYDHLFCSIQTFNSKELWKELSFDYYDFIIVDEFHHSAAPSYQRLLTHFQPKILLGLTATPERMDGEDILVYFNGKITSELRLPEAIDRQLLCPFHYFGVSDSIDLSSLKWVRGGYDKKELTQIYTQSSKRVTEIIGSIHNYVANFDEIKGLGFCVSIEHAMFMADQFNDFKIPSLALTGNSDDEERRNAKIKLQNGDYKFLFVVDIYNEGVDIPEVNTVLFLRPTESLTIFLQQLGRGLRLHESKECLTVLDFIGNANKNYRFEEKYRCLLADSTSNFEKQIKNGFDWLPNGCFINLEKKAKEYILENISRSFFNTKRIIEQMRRFIEEENEPLNLYHFCTHFHIKPEVIYSLNTTFTTLYFSEIVSKKNVFENENLRKALIRIAKINSYEWLSYLLEVLPKIKQNQPIEITDYQRKMLVMFYLTIYSNRNTNIKVDLITQIKQTIDCDLYDELIDLLKLNIENIDFVEESIELKKSCPIKLHSSYSLFQILSAVGVMDENTPNNTREGVKEVKDLQLDLFFVTINKDIEHFSEETMYKDYAISDEIFHWESQNKTSANSPTGQRYIHHQELNSQIMLFVRTNRSENNQTSLYTNLGLVDYLSHQGEKPIAFVWKLQKKMPLGLFNKIKG